MPIQPRLEPMQTILQKLRHVSLSSSFHAQEKHYWRSLGDPTENSSNSTMALISDPRDETVAVLFYIYRYRRQKRINPCDFQANYRTHWLGGCGKGKSFQFSADILNTCAGGSEMLVLTFQTNTLKSLPYRLI